ncbi:hypothetical protein TUM3794_15930 [Shewanella colwelliana]|uniref:histidine kinase n=1 Tax=Shewanella colwelliana TaxID=23 RepID=A0ABQ4NYC8_SHECO|nr:HAMP domain-containing sensor histidine kinase [Shewanella colwelliana]GIU39794.1 hypothetical protein TUM3794_15930 [Shewanella colwelliana]
MSIKRYLFLLFGALIILLGLMQLMISQGIKEELQSELSQSSKTLSQNLVKVLIENVGNEQDFVVEFEHDAIHDAVDDVEEFGHGFNNEIGEITQAISELSQEVMALETQDGDSLSGQARQKLHQALQVKEKELKAQLNEMAQKERVFEQQQRASIVEARRDAAMAYQQRLNEAVSQIQIDSNRWLEDGNIAIIEAPSVPALGELSFSVIKDLKLPSTGANDQLEEFNESMLALILITSLVALILTYLLSHYISAPLSQLARGHQKLGSGELGFQVEEKGVKELKAIFSGFNKMSRQLEQLSEKESMMAQQQQLAELGEVTRGIAHSLRNPLHTVGLLSEAATHAQSSEELQRMLSQIQQKIVMMDKSIQSLLTLSSTQVDRTHQVPLNAIIQDILLELSINGSKPVISFVMPNVKPGENLVVAGAESEIRSIVHAVLINAVEATPDSGTIDVTLTQEDDQHVIVVRDTGKGIPDELKHKLMQPHVTTKTEGTGMGIYIAERLIKGHYRGDIQFDDNPKGGTVVTLTFARDKQG